MENKKTLNRRLELSKKFLEMGQSLIEEGDDFCVKQSGSFMIFLAGIVLDADDTYEFGNLCSMFSAKKILAGMDGNMGEIGKTLNKNLSENDIKSSIENFIKRLRDEGLDNEDKNLE